MKAIFTIRSDFVGDLITSIDGGDYNHCGIYEEAVDNRGGFIIESNPFEGVRKKLLGPVLSQTSGFAILDLKLPNEEEALTWLNRQVGLKYDWLGLLGIAIGADWTRDRRWVCAPLTMLTFIQAGASLYGGPQPGFDYVMGVKQAYETLEMLGAKVIRSTSPTRAPRHLLKR